MRSGWAEMPADKHNSHNRAVELQFRSRRIVVVLTDGREISVPLKFYPTLQSATARDRLRWQVIGKGQGFHWAKLDLDLSTEGMLQGLRESIPKPVRRRPSTAKTGGPTAKRRVEMV